MLGQPHLRPSMPWGQGSRAWLSSWDVFPCTGLGSPCHKSWSWVLLLLQQQLHRDPGEQGCGKTGEWLRSWDEQLPDLSCATVACGFAHQVL